MLAQLLVVALFLFLTLVGQAFVSLFRPRLGVLWSWFAAPTVGLALLIVILTRLNVWGIPVRSAGPWLTLGLAAFAAVVLWWRRPVLPWRQLLPFLAIACGYLLYTGWPMLRFGFNWISYGNDDMANYCLAAERFLAHGYYELPTPTDLEGKDYSQHYWFMHGLQQIRAGSELTLAWVSSITGLRAHQVFMPAILMLSMLQIFALGAVAIFRGRYRKVTLIAFFLFATSPLFGLGTLYQLIAQVAGISLLLCAASVLISVRYLSWRKLAVAGVVTACLTLLYPEVAPFLSFGIMLFTAHLIFSHQPAALRNFAVATALLAALALAYPGAKFYLLGAEGLFLLRLIHRSWGVLHRYVPFVLGTALLTFALIATNLYQFINTLVMQSVGSAGLGAMAVINDQSGGLVLFPWTLVPSFIPMLFGLHPFGVVGVDPWISIQIVIGFFCFGYLLHRVVRNFGERAPTGYLGAVMIFLGSFLFFKGQDFGLFKLAMFAQPIITLGVAQGFAHFLLAPRARTRRWARALLGFFFVCTAPSHVYYSYASLGTYGGGLTEVVGASQLGVGFTPPTDLVYDGIESDISNVVSAKMLAQYTLGIDTRFLSRSYMDNIANIAVLKFLRDPNPDLGPQARIIEKLSLLRFLLPQEIKTGHVPDFRVMSIEKKDDLVEHANNWTETSSRPLRYRDRLFVSVLPELDHFNKANPRTHTGWTVQNMYQYQLESKVTNHLVFIHSEISPHYYSSARFKAAFFQREPEPITGGKVYFHGTGRFNLFNIINPTPNLRVLIDFSRTSLGEGRSKLPGKAIVIGEEDYPIPFVGHGSARVASPIIKPEYFEQQAYITIDFGENAAIINKEKTGLMRLYGLKFNLDDRRLVGFTRDISVITDEEYRALPKPTRIGNFPDDLARYPGLEYSGLFEDGWMAEDAFFRLGASHAGQVFNFKGYVPDTPKFRTAGVDVTISLNGKPTEIVNLKSGDFALSRLIREASEVTSVSLHFSDAEVYDEQNDRRAVSAFVRELAIADIPDFAELRRVANQGGEKLDFAGIDDDGWIGRITTFDAPTFADLKVLKLDVEMPGWAPVASNQLQVRLNGRTLETPLIPRGTYHSLYLPLAAGTRNRIEIEAGNVFALPNETRERSLLIKNLSFENIGPTDLFARGWHKSGYLFTLDRADDDGWVDRQVAFRFPATTRFKTAIVEVVRYPSRTDLPLGVRSNGGPAETRVLELEKTDRIRVPLSAEAEATLNLATDASFPLAAPDTRSRSFRIVNIDFE
jgi:hypothetical protein